MLQYLATDGPTRTGDITSGMTADLSVSAVRERLWVLIGLDNRVEERDRQIVDKDVETGEWGLVDQIENSARGHIPDDQQILLQRMEDEQVRRALDQGCDRRAVMDVLGISRRSTFNKTKRAYAYDFPIDAFSRGGRPTDDSQPKRDTQATKNESDQQQGLEDVVEQEDESLGRIETWGTRESNTDRPAARDSDLGNGRSVDDDGLSEELRRHLQQAIDTLEEANSALYLANGGLLIQYRSQRFS